MLDSIIQNAQDFAYDTALYVAGDKAAEKATDIAVKQAMDLVPVTPQYAVQPAGPSMMQTLKKEALLFSEELALKSAAGYMHDNTVADAGFSRAVVTTQRCIDNPNLGLLEGAKEIITEGLSHMAATYAKEAYKAALGQADADTPFMDGAVYGVTKVATKTMLDHPRHLIRANLRLLQATGNGILNMFESAKVLYNNIDMETLEEAHELAFGNGSVDITPKRTTLS